MTKIFRSLGMFAALLFITLGLFVLPAYAIDELMFSVSKPIPGMSCININEPADPAPWSDNYLCAPLPFAGQIQWSYAGPIANMRCTNINEPADPHTWTDNYLCVDKSFPAEFYWSYSGQRFDLKSVSFNEPADPETWTDNYLGWTVRSLPESETTDNLKILASSLSNGDGGGSCVGGRCREEAAELDKVKEILEGQIRETASQPTFRQLQEWIKKVGLPVAGRRALTFGGAAWRILGNITASDPRTIEREKRDGRLRDFDRERYSRDGDYKGQIERDAKEVARERGCHGC